MTAFRLPCGRCIYLFEGNHPSSARSLHAAAAAAPTLLAVGSLATNEPTTPEQREEVGCQAAGQAGVACREVTPGPGGREQPLPCNTNPCNASHAPQPQVVKAHNMKLITRAEFVKW